MLKKAAILFLLGCYLVFSGGVYLSLHFCAGKLRKVELLSCEKHSACCKGEMKAGCCKNIRIIHKKTSDDNTASKTIIPSVKVVSVLSYGYVCYDATSISAGRKQWSKNNHSPPPDTIPVYLRGSCFLI